MSRFLPQVSRLYIQIWILSNSTLKRSLPRSLMRETSLAVFMTWKWQLPMLCKVSTSLCVSNDPIEYTLASESYLRPGGESSEVSGASMKTREVLTELKLDNTNSMFSRRSLFITTYFAFRTTGSGYAPRPSHRRAVRSRVIQDLRIRSSRSLCSRTSNITAGDGRYKGGRFVAIFTIWLQLLYLPW